MGAMAADLSFDVLRGIFQALEAALGSQHLELHHVRSHTGDGFNEFVDQAAKQEAKQTMNMQRQRLDFRQWLPGFQQLWLLFASSHGEATWVDGGLQVPAPNLSSRSQLEQVEVQSNKAQTQLTFALSLATANVQALYKGPLGHAGKLHYLQTQMRQYHINCVAIQEARSDAGLSQHANFLRFSSGHCRGQYGIEIWFDLEQPLLSISDLRIFKLFMVIRVGCFSAVMYNPGPSGSWPFMHRIRVIPVISGTNGGGNFMTYLNSISILRRFSC